MMIHDRWRVGRRNPCCAYSQETPEPSDDDTFVGALQSPDFTTQAVHAVNTLPEALDVLRDLASAYACDTKGSVDENHPDLGARVGELLGCPECGDRPSIHCTYCGTCPCDCGDPDV
ncbi:hypothetical protein [Nocardiopsis synnemataformans]|uniref:hypothetical protein n=1 Tax=Nocardiopsis synnemataformans TaxID=61305 RepID=UPI003EBAB09D